MRLDYPQNARASDCGDIVGVGDFPRSRLLGVHISLDVVYEFELKVMLCVVNQQILIQVLFELSW